MECRCYYLVGGAPTGPVSSDELADLAYQGRVNATTHVWQEGTTQWRPYAAWKAAREQVEAEAWASGSGLRVAPPLARASRPATPTMDEAPPAMMRPCLACQHEWAENLMSRRGEGFICRLCEVREQREHDDPHRRMPAGMVVKMKADNRIYYWRFGVAVAAMLLLFGFRYAFYSGIRRATGVPDEATSTAWAAQPPAKWPQLALANVATFRDQPPLPPSSSFLVESSDGTILGGSAGLPLWPKPEDDGEDAAGENLARTALLGGAPLPHVAPAQFDADLLSWRAGAPGKPEASLAFLKLHGRPDQYRRRLGIFLRTNASGPPPAEALVPRAGPLVMGMRVTVVWCPAGDGAATQRAVGARVASSYGGFLLELTLDQAVPGAGLCGAPVIDSRGHLAGTVVAATDLPPGRGARREVTSLAAEGAMAFRDLLGKR